MSSRQEKLELARKKLKQYKNKQKQEKGKRGEGRERDRVDNEQQPLQPPPVSGEDHRHEQTTITASSITAAETTSGNIDDIHSQSQLSSNSSLNGSGSYHHVIHSGSPQPPGGTTTVGGAATAATVSDDVNGGGDESSEEDEGAASSPYSMVADAAVHGRGSSPCPPNTHGSLVMTMIPPPDRHPNSQILPSMQFASSEELMQLKMELETAVATISALTEEKQRLETMVEATKNYYNDQFTKNAEVYTSQVNAYQQSMVQSVGELEKKYTVEVQYRQKLEDQISEFQTNKEQLKKENANLKQDLEKTKEIVDEMQEKLLTKSNLVHNLEIKNEELTNSLELANISLKQHRVSIMNLEDSKSKDRKMQFEKEQMQIQITKSKELLTAAQKENSTLTEELRKQREVAEKERAALKNEIFSLKELNEKNLVEKGELAEKIEKLNDQIANIEVKYILRSDVSDIKTQLQQAVLEREQLIAESDSKSKKIEKLAESMNKLTAQYDSLEEQNSKLKSESVDKKALVEKSESDRVTISRALGQNAELKEMVVEKDKKIDVLSKELQSMKDKVSTMESKAENYDSVAQELFLAKNDLENKTQELTEAHEVLKDLIDREKFVECESQTEESGEPIKTETREAGIDPMPCEVEAGKSEKQQKECFEVALNTDALSDLQKRVLNEGQRYFDQVEKVNAEKLDALNEQLQSQATEVDTLKKAFEDTLNEKQVLEAENKQKVEDLESQLKEQISLVDVLKNEKDSNQSANIEHEATMTASNNALKDNYRKLQVKMQALGKECELLRFQNNQLETMNAKLAGENDTIGDYIYMYHAQREAMKDRDKSKSECLDKVMKEKDELTQKVSELQYLLTSILSTATKQMSHCQHQTGPNVTPGDAVSENGSLHQSDETHTDNNASENQSSIITSSPSELLNSEIKAKMIEALETVKSVSNPAPPHQKYLFSTCKCCQGQLMVI